jgi:hypothetical protein
MNKRAFLLLIALFFVAALALGNTVQPLIQLWYQSDSDTISPVGNRKVSMATSQSGMHIISDGDGYVMSASDQGSHVWMTGAGEVSLPDICDTATGYYVKITNKTNTNQVEVAVQDTANDKIVLADGTALDVNDEADLATAAMSSAVFQCCEANTWYIISERGTVTDGGEAD